MTADVPVRFYPVAASADGKFDIAVIDPGEDKPVALRPRALPPHDVVRTCQECHDGKKIPLATAGFVTYGPHANDHDFERYPQMWIASRFMHWLLVFVFAYFWVHSLLWWYREYERRKEGEIRPRVRVDELPLAETRQVRRFGPLWRLAHLLFALSVMTLILTGMAVFYSYTDWAPVIKKALGGPQVAGTTHRFFAVIFAGMIRSPRWK